jgi:hypothetical protein
LVESTAYPASSASTCAGEVAQEEAGVALEVVEVGVVRIVLDARISDGLGDIGLVGVEEVLERLLPKLLIRRCDLEHLGEGRQHVGSVVLRLVQLREIGPGVDAQRIVLGRRLEVLNRRLGVLLRQCQLGQAELRETVPGILLERFPGGFFGLVGLGRFLIDTALGIRHGLVRCLKLIGDLVAKIGEPNPALLNRNNASSLVVHPRKSGLHPVLSPPRLAHRG